MATYLERKFKINDFFLKMINSLKICMYFISFFIYCKYNKKINENNGCNQWLVKIKYVT